MALAALIPLSEPSHTSPGASSLQAPASHLERKDDKFTAVGTSKLGVGTIAFTCDPAAAIQDFLDRALPDARDEQ